MTPSHKHTLSLSHTLRDSLPLLTSPSHTISRTQSLDAEGRSKDGRYGVGLGIQQVPLLHSGLRRDFRAELAQKPVT